MRGCLDFIGYTIVLVGFLVFIGSQTQRDFETRLVKYEEAAEEAGTVVDSFELSLQREDIKFPAIVLAQMVHETNWFSSAIYKENKNCFGMKHNTRGYSIKSNRGHAYYNSVKESIKDYAVWQRKVLFLRPVKTEEEYLSLLMNLPFGQNSAYAEDKKYIEKIKLRMKQLDDLKYIKK